MMSYHLSQNDFSLVIASICPFLNRPISEKVLVIDPLISTDFQRVAPDDSRGHVKNCHSLDIARDLSRPWVASLILPSVLFHILKAIPVRRGRQLKGVTPSVWRKLNISLNSPAARGMNNARTRDYVYSVLLFKKAKLWISRDPGPHFSVHEEYINYQNTFCCPQKCRSVNDVYLFGLLDS